MLIGFAVLAVTTRIQTYVFEHRVLSTLSAMSTLQIGQTSKYEALQRIPGLKPGAGPYGGRCDADECLWTGVGNSTISDVIFLPIAKTHE
jgi:hypothetical protein